MGVSETEASTARETKSILIVEDDSAIADLLAYKFAAEGFTPHVCNDGAEGWEYLQTTSTVPDCLILDLVMPGVDGIELLTRLDGSGLADVFPIVVLTGREADDVVSQAFELGASDFVTKPFSPTALLARVRRLLD